MIANATATCSSSSQSLDYEILHELDKIEHGSLKKRLINELVEFKKSNAYIRVECIEDQNNKYNKCNLCIKNLSINIALQDDSNLYNFIIPRDYPFSRPKFNINYHNYINFIKINSLKTIQELRKYKITNEFISCNSLYSNTKWSPVLKLNCLIDEFKKNKKYRRYIIDILLTNKIKERFLIDDIDLMCWLF